MSPGILAIVAVLIVIIGCMALAISAMHRVARRPNPFGGSCPEKNTCPHCGTVIRDDDAIRTGHVDRAVPGRAYLVSVPAVMHERCARERLAVES